MDTFTVREFAEAVGLSAGRIRQLIVEGRIEATKRGMQLFISESELLRFEKSIKKNPGWPKGKPRKNPAPQVSDLT